MHPSVSETAIMLAHSTFTVVVLFTSADWNDKVDLD